MTRFETWVVANTSTETRRGRVARAFAAVVDSFVQWTTSLSSPFDATEANATNTGVGTYLDPNTGQFRPKPTIVLSTKQIVAANGVLEDRIINNFVDLNPGAKLINCEVRGPATAGEGGQRPLVQSINGTNTSAPCEVLHCTLIPQNPTAYLAGIGTMNYTAIRNHISNVVDYFAIFNNTSGSNYTCRTIIRGNFGEQMVQFQPDVANSNRSHTHNDAIQWQGNTGGVDDVIIEGNTFNCYLNPSIGQPSTVSQYGPRNHVNGLTATINTPAGSVGGTIRGNRFRGGIQTSNLSGTTGHFNLSSNIWQKPGTHAQAPTRMLVFGNYQTAIYSGNVYEDGTTPTRLTS